jgi:hypothetical protein
VRGLWPRAERPPSELITGERLQALAEVSLMSRETREFHRGVERYARRRIVYERGMEELDAHSLGLLSGARSIFVYTHDVDAFIEHVWPRLGGENRVIVSHNSDHEISARHADWLDTTDTPPARWFAQNVTVTHPRLEPIPIGISNSMWPHGKLRALAREMRRQRRHERSGLIYLGFNTATHPAREAVAGVLRESFPGAPLDPAPALPWPRYLALLGLHRFAACPRGNGIDTHRVWEALYLGVVPVVERSPSVEHFAAQGLPMVVVDGWSEVTPERLEHEAERLRDAPAQPAALRLSHYAGMVAAAV